MHILINGNLIKSFNKVYNRLIFFFNKYRNLHEFHISNFLHYSQHDIKASAIPFANVHPPSKVKFHVPFVILFTHEKGCWNIVLHHLTTSSKRSLRSYSLPSPISLSFSVLLKKSWKQQGKNAKDIDKNDKEHGSLRQAPIKINADAAYQCLREINMRRILLNGRDEIRFIYL